MQEGQLIGYSGDTGNCYGAHLHFEVRWKGQRTNPLNWLDADFTTASVAVKLGSYSSVTAPAQDKPAANTSKLQTAPSARATRHRSMHSAISWA